MINNRTRLSRLEAILLLIASAVVLLSRLPFLSAGYGRDPDAFRVVSAARLIAETGEYTASRLPGYPLHEYLLAFTSAKDDPFTSNALTAVSSVIAFVFFALILRYFMVKPYLLLSLAFAAVPVIYINSVTTMDYLFALALMLASLYFTLLNRPLLAGLMLGLAIGFRITSAVFLLTLAYWLVSGSGIRRVIKPLLALGISAGIISVLCYLPVLKVYGLNFFSFYDNTAYPGLFDLATLAVPKVWGILGALGIVASVCVALFLFFKHRLPAGLSERRRGIILCILSASLFFIAFLRLPHEAAYLIPVVPFVLILLALILPPRPVVLLSILMLLSPFLGINSSGISLNGLVLNEHNKRLSEVARVEQAIDAAGTLPDDAVIVSGWLQPHIDIADRSGGSAGYQWVYLIKSDAEYRLLAGSSNPIYFIPGMDAYNKSVYGLDLAELGAEPLPLD